MDVLNNKNDCTGCSACLNACPKNAITMVYEKNGFLYPQIDDNLCINCNLCKNSCPIINSPKKGESKNSFIAFSKDFGTRTSSSSGGVFQTLAKYVINHNGVVVGASFDENKEVKHIIVNNIGDLNKIIGTKYVQSEIGMILLEVKKQLQNNKLVLFSGTSCQIAGLKKYLKEDYDNLITIDLICHGVPSPVVFKKYLIDISNNNIQSIKKIEFRKKDTLNHKHMFIVEFKDGTTIEEIYNENIYIKGFLNNLYLRPSCFNCHFKGENRCSDITLGDFWSAKDFYPDFYDCDGNSSIIIHSNKGLSLFKKIENAINYLPTDTKKVSTWNNCLYNSVSPSSNYCKFLNEYLNSDRVINVIEKNLESSDLNKKSKSSGRFNRIIKKIKGRLK